MKFSFKELATKKVGKVPVVYIAAAVMLGLLVFAVKLKKTNNIDPESDSPDAATAEGTPASGGKGSTGTRGISGPGGGDYSGYDSDGTVIAPGTPVPSPTTDPPPQKPEAERPTNAKWLQDAINWVVSQKLASTGAAQGALQAYMDGNDLSYEQGIIRDSALAKLGVPPEGVSRVGNVGTAPAQKQFSNFPGKHTVKGPNDNTAAKLSNLYYGVADNNHVDKLVAVNYVQGPKTGTYNVGTVITIPAYSGVIYYNTNNIDFSMKLIAAKAGISSAQIQALNPDRTETPTTRLPIGTKLRVA